MYINPCSVSIMYNNGGIFEIQMVSVRSICFDLNLAYYTFKEVAWKVKHLLYVRIILRAYAVARMVYSWSYKLHRRC